jgi:hypothetical protein
VTARERRLGVLTLGFVLLALSFLLLGGRQSALDHGDHRSTSGSANALVVDSGNRTSLAPAASPVQTTLQRIFDRSKTPTALADLPIHALAALAALLVLIGLRSGALVSSRHRGPSSNRDPPALRLT